MLCVLNECIPCVLIKCLPCVLIECILCFFDCMYDVCFECMYTACFDWMYTVCFECVCTACFDWMVIACFDWMHTVCFYSIYAVCFDWMCTVFWLNVYCVWLNVYRVFSLNIYRVFWFPLTLFPPWTRLNLRRTQRVIINVFRSACKVSVFHAWFWWNFVYGLSGNPKISNFVKIHPVTSELLLVRRRTDWHDDANIHLS
jgi:hypothetical protein